MAVPSFASGLRAGHGIDRGPPGVSSSGDLLSVVETSGAVGQFVLADRAPVRQIPGASAGKPSLTTEAGAQGGARAHAAWHSRELGCCSAALKPRSTFGRP